MSCLTPQGKRVITLKDVLHIPNIGINLFSLGRAQLAGNVVRTTRKSTLVCQGDKVLVSGLINPNNAMTFVRQEGQEPCAMVIRPNRTIIDWQGALGHANVRVIEEMVKKNLVEGLKITQPSEEPCEVCPLGKGTRAVHTHGSSIDPKQVGDHVDMDLVTENNATMGGNKYALICKDRFSG